MDPADDVKDSSRYQSVGSIKDMISVSAVRRRRTINREASLSCERSLSHMYHQGEVGRKHQREPKRSSLHSFQARGWMR